MISAWPNRPRRGRRNWFCDDGDHGSPQLVLRRRRSWVARTSRAMTNRGGVANMEETDLRRRLAMGMALAMFAATAQAQVPLDPKSTAGIADILTWRGEKQASGFRNIETIFK